MELTAQANIQLRILMQLEMRGVCVCVSLNDDSSVQPGTRSQELFSFFYVFVWPKHVEQKNLSLLPETAVGAAQIILKIS